MQGECELERERLFIFSCIKSFVKCCKLWIWVLKESSMDVSDSTFKKMLTFKKGFCQNFLLVTLYESFISKYKISWATVKRPYGMLQEPSHLDLSEYSRCFWEGGFMVQRFLTRWSLPLMPTRMFVCFLMSSQTKYI